MSVDVVAQRPGWRAVPWAVWGLLVICGLAVVRSFISGVFDPFGVFVRVVPILLAAVVIYVAPTDRRFVWATLAIAVPVIVRLITTWLPDVWFSVAPGDWKNAVPMLRDLGDIANEIATFIGLGGTALLGWALGGVRTFMSAVILGFAALVAIADVIWINSQLGENFPILQLADGIVFAVLHVLLWAFVFAAALESLRTLTLVGTGLILADLVASYVFLWWQPGPGVGLDLVLLVTSGVSAIGWLLLLIAAFRGELDVRGNPARSRVGRGSSVRQRAG